MKAGKTEGAEETEETDLVSFVKYEDLLSHVLEFRKRDVTHIGMLLLLRCYVAEEDPDFSGETVTVLSRELCITYQAINKSVGIMEKRGYMVRRSDPNDKRQCMVSLTERGLEFVESIVECGSHKRTERKYV